MADSVAIALDAMGGDLAPGMVIKGANIARQRFPQARFLIFGDEGRIKPLLKKTPHLAKVSSIHHTEVVVKSEDKPSAAARRTAARACVWPSTPCKAARPRASSRPAIPAR